MEKKKKLSDAQLDRITGGTALDELQSLADSDDMPIDHEYTTFYGEMTINPLADDDGGLSSLIDTPVNPIGMVEGTAM